ncbi:MAG TPA: hypothetical protein VF275_00610 [Gammaproteobacteria bacterium]
MNRLCIITALLAGAFPVHAADLAPSEVMRRIPSIPESVEARDCAAAQSLLAGVEQQAMADMMRVQRMSMTGGSGGAINGRQGNVIEKLVAPENSACDANVFMDHDGQDIAGEFQRDLSAIRKQTREKIEKECPVIGAGDYRAEPCVRPILDYGKRREGAALVAYITRANRALTEERDAYAACAARHEQLTEEAYAADLPPQYTGLALGNKVKSWQSLALLVNRYQRLCGAAAEASAELANPDRW